MFSCSILSTLKAGAVLLFCVATREKKLGLMQTYPICVGLASFYYGLF